jgi:cell division protein FtsB
MLQRVFYKIFSFLYGALERPALVFAICFVLVCSSLLLDNSLMQLWRLDNDKKSMHLEITDIHIQSQKMKKELLKAKDPEYLARIAVERFDLIKNGDLVFVFTE